jgi:hypothetical protein
LPADWGWRRCLSVSRGDAKMHMANAKVDMVKIRPWVEQNIPTVSHGVNKEDARRMPRNGGAGEVAH